MLGREQLFKELCHLLTEHHMCVVGPPSFGKSVLLHHLASHFKDTSNHYVIPLYWDLQHRDRQHGDRQHGPPRTDDEFRQRFAKRIKDALQPVLPDLATDLELEDESLPLPDLLQLVFEEMEGKKMEGKKVRFLAVLDGFDHILDKSNITRDLWDEMYDLGQTTSLRLVTGSQRRLSELYKPEDSRRWNFSDIFFDTPLQVGCFKNHDWRGFLHPLTSRGITYDDSALKEIANWTGGVPVLAVALAGQLFDEFNDVIISKSDVDEIAEKLEEARWPLLKDLWDDCPTDLQLDLVTLTRTEEVRLPKERHDALKLRGFALESRKNRLRLSCRLMKKYAQQQEGEVSYLQWLFGNEARFKSNIQSLLELRLTQIRGADPRLIDRVKRAIEILQQEPIESIALARSIEKWALKLIWDAELGPKRKLPENWKSKGVCFDDQDQFPEEPLDQCKILRLIVKKGVSKVTRPTQLLVDHLHWVGNFGHHSGRSIVSVPIAASCCLSAISLCESLARDLANTSTEEEG